MSICDVVAADSVMFCVPSCNKMSQGPVALSRAGQAMGGPVLGKMTSFHQQHNAVNFRFGGIAD